MSTGGFLNHSNLVGRVTQPAFEPQRCKDGKQHKENPLGTLRVSAPLRRSLLRRRRSGSSQTAETTVKFQKLIILLVLKPNFSYNFIALVLVAATCKKGVFFSSKILFTV